MAGAKIIEPGASYADFLQQQGKYSTFYGDFKIIFLLDRWDFEGYYLGKKTARIKIMAENSSRLDKLLQRIYLIGRILVVYFLFFQSLKIGAFLKNAKTEAPTPQAQNNTSFVIWFLLSLIGLQILISAIVTCVVRTVAPPLYVDEGFHWRILESQKGRLVIFIILCIAAILYINFFASVSIPYLKRLLG